MNAWVLAICAMAIANNDSAAASLTSDSPVRIAISRLGRPSLRPTATAVTASGGATIAPSNSASMKVNSGINAEATSPTANAVITTIATPRPRIGLMLRMKLGIENPSAAVYNSGGNTTVRRISESSSTRGRPGMNDTASATTTMTSAGCMSLRSATAVTMMAPTSTRMSNSTAEIFSGIRPGRLSRVHSPPPGAVIDPLSPYGPTRGLPQGPVSGAESHSDVLRSTARPPRRRPCPSRPLPHPDPRNPCSRSNERVPAADIRLSRGEDRVRISRLSRPTPQLNVSDRRRACSRSPPRLMEDSAQCTRRH